VARLTYSNALQVAAKILGGREQLRRRLGATEADLTSWMTGEVEPPSAVFLEAVDIMLDHNGY
jgi:hypothetical protein